MYCKKTQISTVGLKHRPLRKTLVNYVKSYDKAESSFPFKLEILLGASTHGDGERKTTLLDSEDEGHEDVVGGCKRILLKRSG